jgi:uncharacterized membrane-anchored protein YjiN (DUF445 family)
VKTLIFLVTLPLVGALIGYVTNAVAIKMLFRPLKPIKIFGIRLPFTPGILPRERHKLADSIGSMVERKLLTPEILRERFLKEDVRAALHGSIAGYTARMLECPLGRLFAGKKEIPPLPLLFYRDFLNSPAFNSFIEFFLMSLADYAGNSNITLAELLGAERTGILREKFNFFIRENLVSQAPQIARHTASALDAAFPDLVRQLLQFLMKDEIHRGLEIQGRIFLDNAIMKLSTFQRFFISAGQYDKTLRERMPEIIDDLIGQLEAFLNSADMRRRIAGLVEEGVCTMASREIPPETISLISSLAMSYITMPLKDAIKKLTAGDPRTVILRIREVIGKNSGAGFDRAAGVVSRILEAHQDTAFSDFFLIDGPKKEKIDAYIGEKILKIADDNIEGLLKNINIKTLVSDRIDSLDMVEVEHIVLDVMANQLKWINVFGAILGALIGGFQVLFSWFAR